MKEIKFRAWDGANRRMVYDEFYVHQQTGKLFYAQPNEFLYDQDIKLYDCGEEEPVLMQFTGLTDKNGKEIYEGDVIRWNRGYVDDTYMDYWPHEPYICKFENGSFFLHCTPNGSGGYVLSFNSNSNKGGKMITCEVVGNIYQPDKTTHP